MLKSEAIKILSEAGIQYPANEVRQIFSHIGNIPTYKLVVGDIETDDERVIDAIRRRSSREPLQYIIGEVEFRHETYEVTPDCLIPRSDTEMLVEYAVAHIPSDTAFIDLCTGSGCVAISTLASTDGTRAYATDVSEATLCLAKRNAVRNEVSERVSFSIADALVRGSLKLPDGERIFAVLSNPPYVRDKVYSELEPEIFYEPRRAFVGGDDGCDFYRAITEEYKDIIDKDGFIAYEIGYDQSEALEAIAEGCSMTAEILRDLSGNPRVAVLKHKY
jgi:release factor glutamine methyltransferase